MALCWNVGFRVRVAQRMKWNRNWTIQCKLRLYMGFIGFRNQEESGGGSPK